MTYEIKEKFITQNRSWKAFTPKGIVLHETANNGGTALDHFNYFNNAYRGASAHVFVDWNEIIQLIPFNEIGWHAGRTANYNYIGIEMCRPNGWQPEQMAKVWEKTVWLFAYIFVNVLGITEVNNDNLMSHAEVSAKWKETDHTDPNDLFNMFGYSVDWFRSAVQDEISNMTKSIPQTQEEVKVEEKSWQQATGEIAIDALIEKGILDADYTIWKTNDLMQKNIPDWLILEMLKRIVNK